MTTLEITTYRIKLVMKETGLSQAELARRVGVAQQTVQKWAPWHIKPHNNEYG